MWDTLDWVEGIPETPQHPTTPNGPLEKLLKIIVARALLNTNRPNDYQILSDEVLIQAMSNEHPLNRTEWNALMDSPITLGRFRVLAEIRWKNQNFQKESPYYKNTEATQKLLGRELTFIQIEHILDNPWEERALGIWEYTNMEKELNQYKESHPQDDDHIQKLNDELTELFGVISWERLETYMDHLLRADFTLPEIELLIKNGVLLSNHTKHILLPVLYSNSGNLFTKDVGRVG
ncbi:MAG: hypothetical protein ACD_71C00245G0002 [uncultured bacterium (gcode 4)]|uniref:Uncharacterized protein n=1 Tax=uncultured bacterium (gcode 4) TaxID=1234023 RepID=K1Z4A1_9BACT|nr:MAG: hypothetical protein ACD_71C00245G0002 [uncultured bacterium (gcode 4)]